MSIYRLIGEVLVLNDQNLFAEANLNDWFTRYISIVYSKWSFAFLDLRSSECTCAQKVLVLLQESSNPTTIFFAITPFSLGCFSGGACRTYKVRTSIYGFSMLL